MSSTAAIMKDQNQYDRQYLPSPALSDSPNAFNAYAPGPINVPRPCSLQANAHDVNILYDGYGQNSLSGVAPEAMIPQYSMMSTSNDTPNGTPHVVSSLGSDSFPPPPDLNIDINWTEIYQTGWSQTSDPPTFPATSHTPLTTFNYADLIAPSRHMSEAAPSPALPYSSPNWVLSNVPSPQPFSPSINAYTPGSGPGATHRFDDPNMNATSNPFEIPMQQPFGGFVEPVSDAIELSNIYPTIEYPAPECPTAEYPTSEYPTTECSMNECSTPEYPTAKYPTTEYSTTEYSTNEDFQARPSQTSPMNPMATHFGMFNVPSSSASVSMPFYNSCGPTSQPKAPKADANNSGLAVVRANNPLNRCRASISTSPAPSSASSDRVSKRKGGSASFESYTGFFRPSNSQVRTKYTEDRKREVAVTRQIGACFKCRSWKATCRPNPITGVCDRCMMGNPVGVCFRLDLSDCGFFRTQSALHPDGGPARQQMDWLDSPELFITVNVADVPGAPPVHIKIRHFLPTNTDMVVDWVRGQDQAVIRFPAVAAVHADELEEEIRSKARMFGKAFQYSMESKGSSESANRILRGAFEHANRNPKSMVNTALDLWACSRMCASERSLEGDERLGQVPVDDPLSPYHNQVPIPPTLDHQCDTVTIKWMTSLASGLLKTLWKKLGDKKKEDWLEVFLTLFIMVNNVEFVYGTQKEFASEYDKYAEQIAPQVRRRSLEWMEKWEMSAKHLLNIYSTFFKSGYPFADESLLATAKRLNPDPETQSLIAYLVRNRENILNDGQIRDAKDETNFNYELFWGREMFKQT